MDQQAHQRRTFAAPSPTDLIQIADGEAWTTSLIISQEFGRAHKSVLRSIDDLIGDGTLNGHDFVPVEYLDAKGESRRAYRLNERAALIAMPFTAAITCAMGGQP